MSAEDFIDTNVFIYCSTKPIQTSANSRRGLVYPERSDELEVSLPAHSARRP